MINAKKSDAFILKYKMKLEICYYILYILLYNNNLFMNDVQIFETKYIFIIIKSLNILYL